MPNDYGDKRERGFIKYECAVCGKYLTSSTINRGQRYDGGTHCDQPLREIGWVTVWTEWK